MEETAIYLTYNLNIDLKVLSNLSGLNAAKNVWKCK